MSTPVGRLTTFSSAVVAVQAVLVIGVCSLLIWLPHNLSREETVISRYAAPKESFAKVPSRLPSAGEPAQLWGAIVPHQSDVWFFKLTGPIEPVRAQESALQNFLQTVAFAENGPTWKLPEGWQAKPGNDFRFATLILPSADTPLELAISKLARGGAWDEQLLVNVNRWRNQLALPPLKAEELSEATQSLTVDGKPATVVTATGFKQADAMGGGPFMK